MESATRVEVIKQAIKQVMMEEEEDDDRQRLLLSKLMSQLESDEESKSIDGSNEEERMMMMMMILKELKKVRRQNVITHCLLSVMIILTLGWQISAVSVILKLKDGVTHPFRTMFKALKTKTQPQFHDPLPDPSSSAPLHDLKLPLPKIDLGFHAQH
ncbi:hypothetical protein R6Q59_002928 [Mikania micrantha]|uniref:Uncharacterized protein n=1 Tax=Mikania micrantha TaxID=192012 RepID=A0A5N6NS00_9ASTR|nr:hypothetical protein E3N88_19931 [Mikania micrantha]